MSSFLRPADAVMGAGDERRSALHDEHGPGCVNARVTAMRGARARADYRVRPRFMNKLLRELVEDGGALLVSGSVDTYRFAGARSRKFHSA